tara:strand:+ start:386 stop:856 length:471 start_codon:yes stop_codon:yes gene_type:complete
MTNIAYIISQFEDEVKEAWELYFKDYAADDDIDFEECKEAFLEEEYNTYENNSSECLDFIHYNLVLYLEMEKEVMDYTKGVDWNGYGIVKVVGMWKYHKASEVLDDITEMEEYDEDKKYICCDCKIDFTDQLDERSEFQKSRKDRMYICMECFDKE